MKILVTGSGGFIGGTLGRYAARAGHQVLGTGRSHQTGQDWPGEYAQADATAVCLSEIIRRFAPDFLFHAAGTASVGASLADPLGDLHAAALACANVLEGVRRSGTKPLVIIPSSAAVYGNPQALPVKENAPLQPISPYGFHKVVCEVLAREYAECFGLDVMICRFFSVFGSAQHRLLVWELHKQLAGPDQIAWVDGTGSESRDFLHIDDVAEVVLQLVEKRMSNPQSGSCFVVNVGRGTETPVKEIAEQLRNMIAPNKEIRCRGNLRPGDPLRWCADISGLLSLLPSWRPRPLAESLALCVAAWQQEAGISQHGS